MSQHLKWTTWNLKWLILRQLCTLYKAWPIFLTLPIVSRWKTFLSHQTDYNYGGGIKEDEVGHTTGMMSSSKAVPVHTMKAHKGAELPSFKLHSFLTSALDGGEGSNSRKGRFTPPPSTGGNPGTYWTETVWNPEPVKVKFSLEQAMKAQRGSRGIALLIP